MKPPTRPFDRNLLAALVLIISCCAGSAIADPGDDRLAGPWSGEIHSESAREIGDVHSIVLEFGRPGAGRQNTIWLSSWGNRKWGLNDLAVTGRHFTCKIEDVKEDCSLVGDIADGQISGTYDWKGRRFVFLLHGVKDGDLSGLERSRVPVPPFPYSSELVSYSGGPNGPRLVGLITTPHAAGAHPAILLLGGTAADMCCRPQVPGNPDQPGIYYWILADALTRVGFVVLRTDYRGIAASDGTYDASTLDDLASDASPGISFLANRKDVLSRSIGVLGHSEGGMIVPMLAARNHDLSFAVVLAAPCIPGKEQYLQSLREGLKEAHERLLSRLKETGNLDMPKGIEAADARSFDRVRRLVDLASGDAAVDNIKAQFIGDEERRMGRKLNPDELSTVDALTTIHFRSTLRADPRPLWATVRIPVLALFGERDTRVLPGDNIAQLDQALKGARNPDATIRLLPGLGHDLQHAQPAGLPPSDGCAEEISPEALHLIVEWLNERLALGRH